MLSALDWLGPAKWPSLLLVTLVPAWFYATGWDGGFGTVRHPVATVQVGDEEYRLWRAPEQAGTQGWCAQPLGRLNPKAALSFRQGGSAVPAHFESGLFCADLPAGSDAPDLIAG